MNTQLTKEEAIAFGDSKAWETWTAREIVLFQLHQECICVPFSLLLKSLSELLNRPVFDFEMLNQHAILLEILGLKPAPSKDEVINTFDKIFPGKLIIVNLDEPKGDEA